MPRSKPNLPESLNIIVAYLSVFVGLSASITQFVALWRGDRETLTYVLAATGTLVVAGALVYIGYSKQWTTPFSQERYIPLFPKFYRIARYALVLVVVLGIVGVIEIRRRDIALESRFVVLLTRFVGMADRDYAVNEIMISTLRNELSEFDDIVVVALSEGILETEGPEEAIRRAERHHADLVLWGWYSVTSGKVLVTENIIVKTSPRCICTKTYQQFGVIEEIDDFQMQNDLAQGVASLALMVSGISQYQNGDLGEAIQRLTIAREMWAEGDPGGLETLLTYRGNAHALLGEYGKALQDYNDALGINPDRVENLINRGVTRSHLGKHNGAIGDFTRAIELRSYYPVGYQNRAYEYLQVGWNGDAVRDFTVVLDAEPQSLSALIGRGIAYKRLGDYSKAFRDYDAALEVGGPNAGVFFNRGVAFVDEGEYEKAIAEYQIALDTDPNFVDAYINMGHAYRELGRYEDAIGILGRALEVEMNSAEAFNMRGNVYRKKGDSSNAITDFDNAIAIDPGYANAYMSRGYAYLDAGEFTRAVEDYRRALVLDPSLRDAYVGLAYVDNVRLDYDRAIVNSTKAIEADPAYSLAYSYRAEAFLALSLTDKARDDLRMILVISDDPSLMAWARRELDSLDSER